MYLILFVFLLGGTSKSNLVVIEVIITSMNTIEM
jgi:hypothetical protein